MLPNVLICYDQWPKYEDIEVSHDLDRPYAVLGEVYLFGRLVDK